MFEPSRALNRIAWNALARVTSSRTLPVPSRNRRYAFIELLAESDNVTVSLPEGHAFLDGAVSDTLAIGDWRQYVYLGTRQWARRAHHAASVSNGSLWGYWELFNPVANQADYLWGTGLQHSGSAVNICTTIQSILQWGSTVLIPVVDYTVLSDRLRLVNTPSAEDAALGQPLSIRV